MMTEELWGFVQSLSLAVPFFSRGPQIIKNFSESSTGALSFVTMTLGWVGSVTRLGTVYAESDDFYYRLQFTLACFFNSIIMLQFLMFWNSDKAKISPGNDKPASKTGKDSKKTQ